jgi:uncharacterized protein with PIN domain
MINLKKAEAFKRETVLIKRDRQIYQKKKMKNLLLIQGIKS